MTSILIKIFLLSELVTQLKVMVFYRADIVRTEIQPAHEASLDVYTQNYIPYYVVTYEDKEMALDKMSELKKYVHMEWEQYNDDFSTNVKTKEIFEGQ